MRSEREACAAVTVVRRARPAHAGRNGPSRRAPPCGGFPGLCRPCAYGFSTQGATRPHRRVRVGCGRPCGSPCGPVEGSARRRGSCPHGPGETGGMDSTGTLRWSAIAHIKFDTCRKRVKSPCPKTGSVTPVTLLGACQRPACHREKTERLADGQETGGLRSSVRVVSAPVPVVGTGAAEGARRAPREPPGPPGPGDVLSRPSRPPERPSAPPALAPLPRGPRLPDGLLPPAPGAGRGLRAASGRRRGAGRRHRRRWGRCRPTGRRSPVAARGGPQQRPDLVSRFARVHGRPRGARRREDGTARPVRSPVHVTHGRAGRRSGRHGGGTHEGPDLMIRAFDMCGPDGI